MVNVAFCFQKQRGKKKKGGKQKGGKKKVSQDVSLVDSDAEESKTNQFTFVERATQTYNKQSRNRDMQTEPPKKIRFNTNLSHCLIYDR